MGNIDYQKVMDQILYNQPHNIDALRKLYDISKLKIELKDIIENNAWNAEEISELLAIYNHSVKANVEDLDEYRNKTKVSLIKYVIDHDKFEFFKGILMYIKNGSKLSEEELRSYIANAIQYASNSKKSVEYLNAILDIVDPKIMEKLFEDNFSAHYVLGVSNSSVMEYFIRTGSLPLIKRVMKYEKNINYHWRSILETGNIQIIKYMIKQGADVNYVAEPALAMAPPIKIAIELNDYKVYKFLKDKGAECKNGIKENFMENYRNCPIPIELNYWCGPKNVSSARDLEYVDRIKVARESTAIEYCITLREKPLDHNNGKFDIKFLGIDNRVRLDLFNTDTKKESMEKLANRYKIFMDLYEDLTDDEKRELDYTNVLAFTIIANKGEMLGRLLTEAEFLNKGIDANKLIEIYFDLRENLYNYSNVEIINNLVKVIKYADPDTNPYKLLFQRYRNKVDRNFYNRFSLNNLVDICIKNLSEEDKKDILVVPNVNGIESLKYLMKNGFDINQQDELGETLLHKVCRKIYDFRNENNNFIKYVIDHSDPSIKNNKGHTPLFYALQKFGMRDEFRTREYVRQETRSDEKGIIYLIDKMSNEDVCSYDTTLVLSMRHWVKPEGFDDKNCRHDEFGEWLNGELCYHNHEELYKALNKKGFRFSNEVINLMLKNLGELETSANVDYYKVDFDATREFIFKYLEKENTIQDYDIVGLTKKIIQFVSKMDPNDSNCVEELKGYLYQLNHIIANCKKFYKDILPKKANKAEYLSFARKKYGIDYLGLDEYVARIFLHIMLRLNKEHPELLGELLDITTAFDINEVACDEVLPFNFEDLYSYVTGACPGVDENGEYEEKIREDFIDPDVLLVLDEDFEFTGTLMQLAYFTSDIEAIKVIANHGGSYEVIIDGEDDTWRYVNSSTVKEIIEKSSGKLNINGLYDDEAKLYLELCGSDKKE